MFARLLPFLLWRASDAFRGAAPRRLGPRSSGLASATGGDDVPPPSFAVKASDFDDSLGLSADERTVVNVHRACSPSVVYVTSVLDPAASGRGRGRGRTGRRRRRRSEETTPGQDGDGNDGWQKKRKLPQGVALGSGSGFVVDSEGFIVTNFHVIQRAYEANQALIQYESFWGGFAKNATKRVTDSIEPLGGGMEVMDYVENVVNKTVGALSGWSSKEEDTANLPAQVFVRFGTNGEGDATSSASSSASYYPCTIVDVAKELDVAVLKIADPPPSLKPLAFGSSSKLVVGQSLVAIGNPFGLDRTITSGLVSALGRSVKGVAGNDIKNCIQTDAAINPGNSGGPLLDLKGNVVGVNTMIISTSGSSAGIGFAVPGDNVKESADGIVELEKERQLRNAKRKGRGYLGVTVATAALEDSLRKRLRLASDNVVEECVGAFVTSLAPDSPLHLSKDEHTAPGIKATSLSNGNIELGDRIVNIGGVSTPDGKGFVAEMKKRVEGEQLSLTVEDETGKKRIVYVTLGKLPL